MAGFSIFLKRNVLRTMQLPQPKYKDMKHSLQPTSKPHLTTFNTADPTLKPGATSSTQLLQRQGVWFHIQNCPRHSKPWQTLEKSSTPVGRDALLKTQNVSVLVSTGRNQMAVQPPSYTVSPSTANSNGSRLCLPFTSFVIGYFIQKEFKGNERSPYLFKNFSIWLYFVFLI